MSTYFSVRDPGTNNEIAALPDLGLEDFRDKLAQAWTEAPEWAKTPPSFRSSLLERIGALLIENRTQLASTISRESGKTLSEAESEVDLGAGYFIHCGKLCNATREFSVQRNGVQYSSILEPLSVACLITPWNFPLAIPARKVAAALGAGCTAVLKPAAETPTSALHLAEIMSKAGVPQGVLGVVTTTKDSLFGQFMLSTPSPGAPEVGILSFTGSGEVGSELSGLAFKAGIRVLLELGGNAPFIVFPDADLELAAREGIKIKFGRVSGQSCVSANRFYVADSVFEEFTELFVHHARSIRTGYGSDPDSQMGPLIHRDAVDRVDGLVRESKSKRICGGRGPGNYFYATVLDDVPDNAMLLDSEIFGPVAPLIRFEDTGAGWVESVLSRAKATRQRLAAYAFTTDEKLGRKCERELPFGNVCVGHVVPYVPETPFGGKACSGFGHEGGPQALEEYLEKRVPSRSLVVARSNRLQSLMEKEQETS